MYTREPEGDPLKDAKKEIKKFTAVTCPISHKLIHDPKVTPTGHSFSSKEIGDWLATNASHPLTGGALYAHELKPNFALRDALENINELKQSILEKLKQSQEEKKALLTQIRNLTKKRKAPTSTVKTLQGENKRLKRELNQEKQDKLAAQRSEVEAELTMNALKDELEQTRRENQQLLQRQMVLPAVYSRKKRSMGLFAGKRKTTSTVAHSDYQSVRYSK